MKGFFVSDDVGIGDMERRQLHPQCRRTVGVRNPCESSLYQVFGKARLPPVPEAKRTTSLLPIGIADADEAAMIADSGMPRTADFHRDPAEIKEIGPDLNVSLGRVKKGFTQCAPPV